ncbi:MAG: 2-oxoacid:acceptor oxidoreductase family protein [Bacteriovorax sp.]|nr:2-oxoacid:acceptor oxidoreductase family protein [Bacteriovorax sp.]
MTEHSTESTDKNRTEILNGNELIIQGALEAGFHLYTGYPGSPLADYFNILYEKKDEFHKKGLRVVIANSEANAAAMASGAKQAHKNALVAMKSMGLHVAADALSVGNFSNPGTGGVVIVVGDDPWSISTSSPADSRYLFKHLHIPFLDPSTPLELKDWMKKALEISLKTSVYQGLLLTTFMAEGGGRVEIGAEKPINSELIELDPATFDLSKNVMVPPNSLRADVAMINERFPKVLEVLKEFNLDKVFGNTDSKVGFITSGAVFEILKHVLDDNHALDRFSLYKVAAPYPLISELLIPYLEKLDTLIVVEEKRGFLETEIYELCARHNLKLKIFGKKIEDKEGFPIHGGLNYEIVVDKVSFVMTTLGLGACHTIPKGIVLAEALPRRLPTFCPGCPHRETLSLLKDLRGHLKKQNINLISHGDVGCYSLSFLEPFKEMHNLSAMGQGGALGAGVDLFTTNPSVVLMGDSTFFHSGITDISNSVQMNHDITYIILDNDNTAMTGHQFTPRTGQSVEGFIRPAQDMLKLVSALGVNEAIEVNPSDRYFYQNLLREIISKKGTKVIISNKECGLTFHGKKKAEERKLFAQGSTVDIQRFYQINTDACEDCRACVELTGCPGLSQTFDPYGTKVTIDPQICVADSYCTKIKVCPSFELVEVANYHPSKYKSELNISAPLLDFPIPKIKKSLSDIAKGVDYRLVVTGVGGSGVTTISRVLAEAAKSMGGRSDIDFKFVDQKGLAQRNGNVTSHLALFKLGKSHAQVTPLGGADLLLSPDLLDGSQHLGFLSLEGCAILDEKFQIPLSILLDKGVEREPVNELVLQNKLKNLLSNRIELMPLKEVCEEQLGKSVYASAMILGAAYQLGLLPFELSDLEAAFKRTMKKAELENNLTAFNLGRGLSIGRRPVKGIAINLDQTQVLKQSIRESSLLSDNTFVSYFELKLKKLQSLVPSIEINHLAQYIHDLIIYDRGLHLDSFLSDVEKITNLYSVELQNIAVRTLAKTYFIKDEVYIAHMMISPMRRIKDEETYRTLGSGFTKKFINRPSFDIGSKKIEFDFSPKPWMLRIMRHARFLRSLLPSWHKLEREIAHGIKQRILGSSLNYSELKLLENIKGYREVRYTEARVQKV